MDTVRLINTALADNKQVAEEHIIEARINEYKQPRQVLEGTMRNCLVDWRHGVKSTDLGKRYVVAGATLNLDDATSKVKLIEMGLYGKTTIND